LHGRKVKGGGKGKEWKGVERKEGGGEGKVRKRTLLEKENTFRGK
jgi:hypothetical protein